MNSRFRAVVAPLALGVLLLAPRAAHAVSLVNPLGDVTDPRVIVGNVISAIISVIGSIAFLMFVYGGVLWITSFGDSAKVDKGKKVLVWATMGLGMIAASYVLVNAVIQGLATGSAA